MKLIVGLGNIGDTYTKTRHNIGFEFVDFIVQKHMLTSWKNEKKFFGMISTGQIGREKVLILKPSTFMNVSGKSVTAVTNFYKIPPQDILVIFDDVDMPFGVWRYREKGGSGGHNGLKSIFQSLGSQECKRLKFGIRNDLCDRMDTANFVLGRFNKDEQDQLPQYFKEGEEKLLSIYN